MVRSFIKNNLMTKRKLKWLPKTAYTEDITDDQYFQDAPWKDYISNSKLGLVDPSTGGSVQLFTKSFDKTKRSKAFQTGTIVHSLLLQADNYGISDVIRPSGKLGELVYDLFKLRNRPTNTPTLVEAIDTVVKFHGYYNGKPSKKILLNAIRDGYAYYRHLGMYKERDFILSSEEVRTTLGCLESLKANKAAYAVLFPADPAILRFNEMAIACDVMLNETKYTLKAKIDNWTLDVANKVATLNDLKTSGAGLQNFVEGYWEFYPGPKEDVRIFHPGSFQKYKYYRQLAMYAKILSLYIEKEYKFKPTMNVNIVAVETKEPYYSETFNFGTFNSSKFNTRQLDVGLKEMEDLLWLLKDNKYVPETGGFTKQSCAFI